MDLPSALRRNVLGNWGERGEIWLGKLPGLVDEFLGAWRLTVERPFAMTYHWVAAVRRHDGSAAVLKLGVADGHQDAEAHALRLFDGYGAVRLLAEDLSRGALLIERAEPGTTAASLPDQEATARIVEVGRKLHRPITDSGLLTPLAAYGKEFIGYAGSRIPPQWISRAHGLLDELSASATERVVLHGDLHHGNVLCGRAGEWLAIDPFGLVGDPGYDCAQMLWNPDIERRDPDLLRSVPARIEQLADGFGIPVERVAAWGFVKAVLSEVWTAAAPGASPTRAFDVAELLYRDL